MVSEDRFDAQHKSNRRVIAAHGRLIFSIEQPNVDAALRIHPSLAQSNVSDLFACILIQNQQAIGPEVVRMSEFQTHTLSPARFGTPGGKRETEA